MSTHGTGQTDMIFDGLSRDLVRLAEAYMIDDHGAADRITTRIVVTLCDLYTAETSLKINFWEINFEEGS